MYHALIMAGGSGTRMWPLSRKQTPKQALPLLEERSMFRVTAERLAPLISLDRVWVVTNAEMAEVFKTQVPGIPTSNYVIEPNARDSGPAAGLGLAHIHAVDPDATVAILSADHHITDVPAFLSTLALAEKQAQHGHIVLIGINPTFASTAFGYIEKGRALVENVFEALRFTEKPREDIAEQYFSGGMHSWNSGMFIMKAATGMDEFTKQHPAFAQALLAMQPHIGTSSYATALDTAWNLAPRKSIDYAIMENAQALAVIPVDIGWSDIGSWAALMDALPKDAHENAISGEHVSIDTFDTLVRGSNGRLIATIGVARLAIIDTPDALLICSLDRVQDVKKVVDELKRKKRDDLV
jgi:mannose-1-phosphate guanylyltransferase/mannose-6-phosphate isomerase